MVATATLLNDLAVNEVPPNRKIIREWAAQALTKNGARQQTISGNKSPKFKIVDANERYMFSPPCKGPYEVVGENSQD